MLDLLGLFILLLFHSNLVVPYALDGLLKVVDLLVLHGVVAVLFVEFRNQLSQLEFFALNEDVVTLQVLILLLGQNHVQLIVELRYLIIDLLLLLEDHIVNWAL